MRFCGWWLLGLPVLPVAGAEVVTIPPVADTCLFIPEAEAIDLGNGFASLHPMMEPMMPLFNAGELAVVHRVGYANLARTTDFRSIFGEIFCGHFGTPAHRLEAVMPGYDQAKLAHPTDFAPLGIL